MKPADVFLAEFFFRFLLLCLGATFLYYGWTWKGL